MSAVLLRVDEGCTESDLALAATRKLAAGSKVVAIDREDCRGCGECCGRYLPMTLADRIRVEGYVRTHGIVPRTPPAGMLDLVCPYLSQEGECMVYEARPEICRRYSCKLHAAGEIAPWPGLYRATETDMRDMADRLAAEMAAKPGPAAAGRADTDATCPRPAMRSAGERSPR